MCRSSLFLFVATRQLKIPHLHCCCYCCCYNLLSPSQKTSPQPHQSHPSLLQHSGPWTPPRRRALSHFGPSSSCPSSGSGQRSALAQHNMSLQRLASFQHSAFAITIPSHLLQWRHLWQRRAAAARAGRSGNSDACRCAPTHPNIQTQFLF